jgi:hypothetical protein
MQTIASQPQQLEVIAREGGVSIAESILARVKQFPKREGFLTSSMKRELESVPSQILWRGLEDEAAPVFVVYKLLHEAFSNSPMFFRRFITSLMLAQPERFSRVFSRETLWSLVARTPGIEVPADWASPSHIRGRLEKLNLKSFWRRSDAELQRDAESISAMLTKDGETGFLDGVKALRRLQAERATGLTNGNLMLFVPAKLTQYVTDVAELGLRGCLPDIKEMWAKVHEIVRDPLGEGRHQSIPIDVLFTEPEGETLECFVLVREKKTEGKQVELRRNSLLVRYFLKYAFSAYDIDKLRVRLAFYLDPESRFDPLEPPKALFYEEEMLAFEDFWEIITGKPGGASLVLKARDAAAEKLKTSGLMKQIKDHFSRDRKLEREQRAFRFNPG